MRRSAKYGFLAATAVGLLSSCLSAGARPCDDDGECLLGGRTGTCEAIGYCSYLDDDCDDGAAFGPYAGGGLAGVCVGDADSGAGTTSASTSTSTVSSSDCATACPEVAATVVFTWSATEAVRLADLDIDSAGSFTLGGHRPTGDAASLLAVHFDADGTELWSAAADAISDARVVSASHDDSGSVWIGGNRGYSGAQLRPFVAQIDGGDVISSTTWATSDDDELLGMGVEATGGIVVGGVLRGRPWAERIDANGATVWSVQWDAVDGRATPARFGVTPGGLSVALGSPVDNATGVAMRVLGTQGGVIGDTPLGAADQTEVLFASLGEAGVAAAGIGEGAPWVVRADYDGTVRWNVDLAGEPALDVAILADGSVAVVASGGADTLDITGYNVAGTVSWTAQLEGARAELGSVVSAAPSDRLFVATLDPAATLVTIWSIAP